MKDSSAFKCYIDGRDDPTVTQDEKMFAAIRPRYYMEHLEQMTGAARHRLFRLFFSLLGLTT